MPLKTTLLGVLADIDEAADTDDLVAKPGKLTLPAWIDLGERQKGDVEAAAIVEIELVGRVDQRIVVLRGAGIWTGQRRAADEALLVGQDDIIEDIFLGRDR